MARPGTRSAFFSEQAPTQPIQEKPSFRPNLKQPLSVTLQRVQELALPFKVIILNLSDVLNHPEQMLQVISNTYRQFPGECILWGVKPDVLAIDANATRSTFARFSDYIHSGLMDILIRHEWFEAADILHKLLASDALFSCDLDIENGGALMSLIPFDEETDEQQYANSISSEGSAPTDEGAFSEDDYDWVDLPLDHEEPPQNGRPQPGR